VNKSLRQLNLCKRLYEMIGKNLIGDEGSLGLGRALEANTSIQQVYLGNIS